MADDLKAIVQRMIDAGESEDNIATVIQHFKQPYTPDPTMQAATIRALARQSGGLGIGLPAQTDEVGNQTQPTSSVAQAVVGNSGLQSLAHPTSVADMAGLVLPSTLGPGELSIPNLTRGTLRVLKAGGEAAAQGPVLSSPVRFIRGAMTEFQNTPKTIAETTMRNYNRLPMASQAPSAPPSLGSGPSAAGMPTVPQGTFTKLPDGTWAVLGRDLSQGGPVNVTNRAGAGTMHTVDKMLGPDELDQLIQMAPRPPGTQVGTLRQYIMQRLSGGQ